ncbi:MAG TPA: Holliday junction resolvase RuvX [Tepidisphaeraceae bacterium]|jgi:putative Holliday junction resolvase|nr:Holliday junction resolvase RuvX [Tepidisphaeraceae bacterium]
MRTLAIDLGARRIGVALSDAGGKLATPYDVVQGPPPRAIDGILKVIEAEEVQRIVVGLPLNMDGTRGPAANEAVEFGRHLSARSGTTVIFVDERLSTFQAEQDLSVRRRGGEKITRKSKKRRLDALAAAQFLQEFLDGKLEAIDF